LARDFGLSERQEMALWCFPIVCDLLGEQYGRALGPRHTSVRMVAFTHSQLWRAMLLDDQNDIRKLRGEMSWNVQALGLPPGFADELDDLVLDELMEVVTQRFHRSPMKSLVCSHILLQIARNLVYAAEAVAAA
jgi:hypothetical protein